MGAGRPTLNTPEMVEAAYLYLESYKDEGDVIPSIAGMAIALGVGRRTLHDWGAVKDSEFSRILDKCNALQERVSLNGGLSGDMNATIVKLLLGKHGYHDSAKTDVTSGGKTINNWTVNPVTTNKDG